MHQLLRWLILCIPPTIIMKVDWMHLGKFRGESPIGSPWLHCYNSFTMYYTHTASVVLLSQPVRATLVNCLFRSEGEESGTREGGMNTICSNQHQQQCKRYLSCVADSQISDHGSILQYSLSIHAVLLSLCLCW